MESAKCFFVLWNGSEEGFDSDDRQLMIEETSNGIPVSGGWSFGRGYGDPLAGDHVYMLRTGKMRGVVASGQLVTDGAHPGEHWEDSERQTTYVDVRWDVMLTDEDRLPTEKIERALIDFKFPVKNSGRLIPEPLISLLVELWEHHLEELERVTGNPWLGGRRSSHSRRTSRRIPLEANRIKEYEVGTFLSYRARRAESEMVHRFAASLRDSGADVSGYQLQARGFSRPLLADLFDHTANVLYEAKASSSRESVRMALGQLLDYRRHFETAPFVSVLLPDRPSDDLINLLREHGVGCVYEDSRRFVYELTHRVSR